MAQTSVVFVCRVVLSDRLLLPIFMWIKEFITEILSPVKKV